MTTSSQELSATYHERLTVDDPSISAIERKIHRARYEFATRLDLGPRVLDCACGHGYGSAILGEAAGREVVGVDVSETAVAAATATHQRPRVRFQLGNALEPGGLPSPFSAVVSFETIEHVNEPDRMLRNFGAVLQPGGLLVISTPNGGITSPLRGVRPANQFHCWEEDVTAFSARLQQAGFRIRESYGQAFLGGPMLPLYRLARARGQLLAHGPLAGLEAGILRLEGALVRAFQSRVVAEADDALPTRAYPLVNCVYQVHVCEWVGNG